MFSFEMDIALNYCGGELLLTAEVMIKRALGDTRSLQNFLYACSAVAVLPHQLETHADQVIARGGCRRLRVRRSFRGGLRLCRHDAARFLEKERATPAQMHGG